VEGSNPSFSGDNSSLEAAVATSRAKDVNRPDGGSSFGPAFQSDRERRNADHMGHRSKRSPKATTEPLSEVDGADVAALHTAGEECPTCDGDPQPDAGATKPVRRDQRRVGAEKGVEHGIARLGKVQELVRQHSDGFGRGMILQTPPGRRKSVGCLLYGAGDILRTHFGIDHFFVI
jgi:hypothetical protein